MSFGLELMKISGNRSDHPVLHYLSFNPWLPGCCVCLQVQPGGKNTTQHSPINKGQWKGTLGLSGDRRGGKLAHIRLIRGPQSPLTFASQSQVARFLCYRPDYVLSAPSSLVQMVLKAQGENSISQPARDAVQVSGPRTALVSIQSLWRENPP